MRVCFFGAYDPDYPRNRILRSGLTRAGCEVVEARVPERRAFRRYPELALRHARAVRAADVVVVPEFRHKDVPLARWLCGSAPLVFDPLVSRHDTLVGDWGLHREGSGQARWNRMLDRWTLSLGDRVLCDTWAQGKLYQALGVAHQRLRRVLVGAEDLFFEIPDPPSGLTQVLYVGGFLPLHGVMTMLEAMAIVERGGEPLAFTLVGDGIEFDRARAEAERLALRAVSFVGRVPYPRLPALLGKAHIVLGAFGASDKAGRVIPHKVYQGLAAGRVVVSGDGEGVREVFEDGVHLRLTPRADAAALAAVLVELGRDPARRAGLGAAGRARVREVASVDAIGTALAAELVALCR